MTTVTQIEAAIIARIKAAQDNDVLGYTLKKLDTYGGEFAEGLKKAVVHFPAILVIYGGSNLVSSSTSTMTFTGRWMIMVGAKNLRNEAAARKGSGDKVGSYQMAEDVIALLGNNDLGLDITALKVNAIRPLANDLAEQDLASVYAVEISTTYTIDTGDDPTGLDDFETFHANWDIPPHGNVTPPLPTDEDADATDNVTLETT